MDDAYKTFEFRRTTDPTTYRFHLDGQYNDRAKWKRSDKDLWCLFDGSSWIVADEFGTRLGWPRDERADAGDHPPGGIWSSKKGDKSYEYELVYVAGNS
jgi:hypothetical protein